VATGSGTSRQAPDPRHHWDAHCSALSEYLILWQAVEAIELRAGFEDIIRWKWTSHAAYSARSAYLASFQGTMRFEGAKPIWKAWAPLKVKFFMLLAVRKRIWIGRRCHRGLTGDATCRLCDQEKMRWLTTCSALAASLGRSSIPYSLSLASKIHRPLLASAFWGWWLLLRQDLPKEQKKGLDTAVMLAPGGYCPRNILVVL
jgi:hypothetical protein